MTQRPTCDLHLHSTASDGTDPPRTLARLAQDAGLSAFALTDHDTTAGLAEAQTQAHALGLAFVPGIELSADPASILPNSDAEAAPPVRSTLHILGYFIDNQAPGLTQTLSKLQDARAQRNPAMVQKLNELGIDLSYAEVQALAAEEGAAVVGRPHIAQALLNRGEVSTIAEAFTRYLSATGLAHVRKDRLTAADAIAAIHDAGGLAVLAHFVQLRLPDDTLDHAIHRLADLGLDGIETHHADHTPADRQRAQAYAQQYQLTCTGGSDYHGRRKPIALGSQDVPMDLYHQLRDAHARRR